MHHRPGPRQPAVPRLSAQSSSLPAMATFVLIHGAGDAGWYWHLTGAAEARGHHTIAPDLPCDNDTASLNDYAGTVIDAARGQQDLVIVGQSYGAFTATLVARPAPRAAARAARRDDPGPRRKPGPMVEPAQATGTPSRSRPGLTAARPATMTRSSVSTTEYRARSPRKPCAEAGAGSLSTVWNTRWPLDAWPKVATRVHPVPGRPVSPRRLHAAAGATAPRALSPTRSPAVTAPRSATRRN